jgi:hypothetical protein
MTPYDAGYWIKALGLKPHPEGGFYCEVYRSTENIQRPALPSRYSGDRVFSTSIYFLLRSGEVSRFHRLRSDEVWHFYEGSAVVVHVLKPGGSSEIIQIGREPSRGESFQAVLRAGWWFGAEIPDSAAYALIGCTLAPGFDFADFELARREDLLKDFPVHGAIIERLTLP